ncbi:hypothetical protein GPALN_011329 [Globodera pallida]|nr:hypothetical protein GPALN_011329 [Globodera pallida]
MSTHKRHSLFHYSLCFCDKCSDWEGNGVGEREGGGRGAPTSADLFPFGCLVKETTKDHFARGDLRVFRSKFRTKNIKLLVEGLLECIFLMGDSNQQFNDHRRKHCAKEIKLAKLKSLFFVSFREKRKECATNKGTLLERHLSPFSRSSLNSTYPETFFCSAVTNRENFDRENKWLHDIHHLNL